MRSDILVPGMRDAMRTRDLIHAEVDKVEEESLPELYTLVKGYAGTRAERAGDLMERLLQIKIEGPEDWSRNIDAYLNGEKPLGNGEDPR
jgi:hypothetical protein